MIKPNDIYILLSMHFRINHQWTYNTLSDDIGVAKSEMHRALQRIQHSHLYNEATKQIKRKAMLDFLTHGLRYAFAVISTTVERGYPTCWSAPGLEDHMVDMPLEEYVWPDPNGTHIGRQITPLHRVSTASYIEQYPKRHQTLALCDVMRLGSARQRHLASKLLDQMI